MPDQVDHRFHRMLRESWLYLEEHRKDADQAWDFRDGKHWTPNEAQELQDRHQQASVINICEPIVNMFAAIEQQRRTDYVVVGRERSDDAVADILTALINHTYSDNGFSYFLGQGAKDGAIGGIGFFEVGKDRCLDTNEDVVRIWQRPWEEFFYDPHARHPTLNDARYIIRQIWMDRDIAAYTFPKFKEDLEAEFTDDAYWSSFDGLEQEARLHSDDAIYAGKKEGRSRRISINSCYYKSRSGRIKHVVFSRNVFLDGTLSDDDDSDMVNPSPFKYNFFPYIPFIAGRDKKGRPVGILRHIIPLNETINKALSKWLWNMSSNQILFESDAFPDIDGMKEQIARPDGRIEANPGAIKDQKFIINKALAESAHLMEMMSFLVSMAQRISGVNDALIGIGGTNARSALQESSRISQGSAMQSSIIENLYFTKRQITRCVLKLIGQYYTKKRIVRVTGIDGETKLLTINGRDENGNPLNQIGDILHFDVDLKEELPFTTVRESLARSLAEIMKSFPPLAQVLITPFLHNLPIPNKDEYIKQAQGIFKEQLNLQQQQFANEQRQMAGLQPLAA